MIPMIFIYDIQSGNDFVPLDSKTIIGSIVDPDLWCR